MRIAKFRIENFRNIRLAECESPPDFLVICGGNGCGKSALLHALMTAKEHAGAYGQFQFDPRAVSADADFAAISLTLQFNSVEQEFVDKTFHTVCPEEETIEVTINKAGSLQTNNRSNGAHLLLSSFSRTGAVSPGFFDYIEAHRRMAKRNLSTWEASSLSDDQAKQTLGAEGANKFQNTKNYLAGLVMQDLQELQRSTIAGAANVVDSLEPIKRFFNTFFAPLRFVEVRIDQAPFTFVIETPRGRIDIDDLSAGEKEIFNSYVRFHQLNPRGAIILFDEADAHLHPDLERRYLNVLRDLGIGNQLWLTTHSPEMMIAAGSESLYTVLKEPIASGGNQFVRVTSDADLHEALTEVMGSRGLVSFNQRIVFIEGEESSADREIYERFYPPGTYNVSFVPAGNSATVRMTAEKVNALLSSSLGFQHYFSIVDGDIDRAEPLAIAYTGRLFRLPVYHVENFLLESGSILEVIKEVLLSKCPYSTEAEITSELEVIVLSDQHLKPYTRALLDAKLALAAKELKDHVFKGTLSTLSSFTTPDFASTEVDAQAAMMAAIKDNSWRLKCKGREVMKGFCIKNGLNYEHFRNLLIGRVSRPKELEEIMQAIAKG